MASPLRWIWSRKEGPQAVRRAVWVVLAGGGVFYTLLYGFHQPVMGLYAMFGALPMIMFAHLSGPAARRGRTMVLTLPAAWVMVTAGTLLAVNDWAAAGGLLVLSFLVAFLGVLGPRQAALAAALQLYYVLPCFPPYEPHQLWQRLAGITLGVLAAVVVDQVLWRESAPTGYRGLLADAADAVADYTRIVARLLAGQEPAASAEEACAEARARAGNALATTWMSRVSPTSRPLSASMEDRALNHCRAAIRHTRNQLDGVVVDSGTPDAASARLLLQAEATLRQAADEVRSRRTAAERSDLADAHRTFEAERAGGLLAASPQLLRQQALVRGVAQAAQVAEETARLMNGVRPQSGQYAADGPFGYASVSAAVWSWRRLVLHMTPRSVLFQNGVRMGLALGAARVLAGVVDIPHGFWVLLATLSMMRTSAADTRAGLGPAFLGTVAGAAVSTVMLMVVGDTPGFYIGVAPVLMLVGFTVGPLLGGAWMQAVLTVVLMVLFVQVLSVDTELPAVRVLTVVVGGLIGAGAALLAWPKGAAGQLKRDVAHSLRLAGEAVPRVTDLVSGGSARGSEQVGERDDPLGAVRGELFLAHTTFLQFRTESTRGDLPAVEAPWEAYMLPGYQVVGGGSLLVVRAADAHRELPAAASEALTELAGRAAAECRASAALLRRGAFVDGAGPGRHDPFPADASPVLRLVAEDGAGMGTRDVLLMVDTESWLTGVARDARRARQPKATAEGATHG
ncbi:FUSC family protein [Streptomyces sp. cg36]|uniref:FUSC family protein n=1 Tax=Streptomyces sp. cg36 TaxID=3238798 RepID=UPI0034E2284E